MNIIFAGTPEFAVPSLNKLADSDQINIIAVITQPDRRRGRGKKLKYSPVKKEALKRDLKVLQPKNINGKKNIEQIKDFEPDLLVVVAYGQILSEEFLNIFKKGSINLHASLLPEYRGSSPIQQAILDGKANTGITTMYIKRELDQGDIIYQEEVEITKDDNAGTLHDKLSIIGSELLKKTIIDLKDKTVPRIKQSDKLSSYTEQLKKEDGLINWEKDSNFLFNFVRAMNPWPGSFTYLNGKFLKIFKVETIDQDTDQRPGSIVKADPKEGFFVQTGNGLLEIKELQLAGKNKMTSKEFLRGYKIGDNSTLTEKGSG
ncbi:MAG: methionyl-tRNA formyltransferase [Halanaerobiales bacterium]|nr:methionyl-tRNA formyltransferase [Halanaerobiales bacterium]